MQPVITITKTEDASQNARELDAILDIWVTWSKKAPIAKGYPKTSAFAVLRSGSNNYHYFQTDTEDFIAYEVEQWINDLKKIYPLNAKILIDYYLAGMEKDSIARKYVLSVRRVDERLNSARLFLESQIVAQRRHSKKNKKVLQ